MDFIDSLIENDSIILDVEAHNWEDVIQKTVQPLINSNAVTQQYVDEIIKSTYETGPYYILKENFAMPHAEPGYYVKKDSFSFITLKEPVLFPEDQFVKVLVCLATTSHDNHLGKALPQIATLFSDKQIFTDIDQAESKTDILNIFKERDRHK